MVDLVIKDVPDDKTVQEEIMGNAMTTIANFMRRNLPKSQEETTMEAEFMAIKDKNIPKVVAVNEEPAEEIKP